MSGASLPLAVVGMAGAGKSAVTGILTKAWGLERVYFGQIVLEEVAALGMPPGAQSEREVREKLRAEEGMDVMARRSLPRIRAALDAGRPVCIDGLYSGAEWDLLAQETGLVTLAVHAPRWLRKQRLGERAERPLTGAELDQRDLSEVDLLDKAKPIALADAHVVNDGSFEQLRDAVDEVLQHLDAMRDAALQPV